MEFKKKNKILCYGNLSYTSENRYKINSSEIFIQEKPLTSRWTKGFTAAKEAIVYTEGKCPGHFMGAAIYSGNRLLSVGNNCDIKTKPGNSAVKVDGTQYNISCHAEQMAIDKIKYREVNKAGLIMYVVRLRASGEFATSRPCTMCIDYMKAYGIRVIRFINKNGIPEEMRLR